MLNVIKPTNESSEALDWHKIWRSSPEFADVKKELARLNALQSTQQPQATDALSSGHDSQHQEFVSSFWTQFREVLIRTWKHFWRSPTYLWSKIILIVLAVSCLCTGVSCSQILTFISPSILDSASPPATACRACRTNSLPLSCFLCYLATSTSRSCPCLFRSELCMRFVNDRLRSTDGLVSRTPRRFS